MTVPGGMRGSIQIYDFSKCMTHLSLFININLLLFLVLDLLHEHPLPLL